MGIETALGIGGIAASVLGSNKQSDAIKQASQQLTTTLPLYTGYGVGGSSAGLGVAPSGGNFSFAQLLSQDPYALAGMFSTGGVHPVGDPATGLPVQSPAQTYTSGALDTSRILGSMGYQNFGGQWYPGSVDGQPYGTALNPTAINNLVSSNAGQPLSGIFGNLPSMSSSGVTGSTATPTGTGFGINLGNLAPSASGLTTLAQQAIGRAGMTGGNLPSNVLSAANILGGFGTPGDPTAALLASQIGQLTGQSVATQDQMANAYSPITSAIQGTSGVGALNAIQQASLTGDQQRQQQLDLLRQEAAPQEAKALQSFRDALFATGRGATTGGAMQTEAFAKGLAQADITRQLQAAQEGRSAQTQALNQATGLSGLYSGATGLGENLLNSAFGRFAQTQDLLNTVGSNVFQRNLGLNELGYNRAQGNLQTQIGLAQLPSQLQTAQLAPALQALQGISGLQTSALQPFQQALQLAQAQANAQIGAGSNLAALTSSADFGAPYNTVSNALLGIGERLGSGSGSNFLASAFNQIPTVTGSAYGTNPFSQQSQMLAAQNFGF